MMKTLLKTPLPIAVLLAASLLAGCVRSLHPIYTSSDVVLGKHVETEGAFGDPVELKKIVQ